MKTHLIPALVLLTYAMAAMVVCLPLAAIWSPARVVLVAVSAVLAEFLAIVLLAERKKFVPRERSRS